MGEATNKQRADRERVIFGLHDIAVATVTGARMEPAEVNRGVENITRRVDALIVERDGEKAKVHTARMHQVEAERGFREAQAELAKATAELLTANNARKWWGEREDMHMRRIERADDAETQRCLAQLSLRIATERAEKLAGLLRAMHCPSCARLFVPKASVEGCEDCQPMRAALAEGET